jgi:gamma-glutamyl-gamma-aminobutyrate hydrolase PuuD
MARTPRIGVTTWEDVPEEARQRYRARVVEAAAEVVDLEHADPTALASLDGLVLTGGIDVDPARYGAERHVKVRETDAARDEMEVRCLQAALDRDIPVLAICRGHQLLNVALGGSLLQHIDSGEHRADYRTEGYPSRWHELRIETPSLLSSVWPEGLPKINSRHHQAVTRDGLAPGLRVTASSHDGDGELVEGVESDRYEWVVGVQWHPERLEPQEPAFAPAMRRLFAAFIAATRRG